jgi:hypothetical protein
MFFKLNTTIKNAIIGLVLLCIISCSATTKYIKHGKLETQTRMSETIFLDPISEAQKTVLLQIRNTTGKSGLDITNKLKEEIEAKGYRIVNDPAKANIMIQANILQAGKATMEDPFQTLTGGYGSALAGAATGAAVVGALGGSGRSMAGGAVAIGAVEYFSDAMVQVVVFSMITDLQISERAEGAFVTESSNAKLKQGTSGSKSSSWEQKTNWKRYQTRIVSTAKKTNLKFEQAEPELTNGLVKSISGIL